MLVAGCILLALSCSAALTGCSNQDAAVLAKQACSHVELGLAAERKASSANRAQATRLEAEALDQVRAALPLAAVAAGEDTSWQALDATLSESNRVPLHYLVGALGAQCSNPSGDG
jgi:hypothetical protein